MFDGFENQNLAIFDLQFQIKPFYGYSDRHLALFTYHIQLSYAQLFKWGHSNVSTWKDLPSKKLPSKSMLEKALVKNKINKCSFCSSDNGNLCQLEKSDAIFSVASHIHLEIQAT